MEEGKFEKVSILKCRNIFKRHGYNYTDAEIEKIRDFLYLLGEIEYGQYLKSHDENSNHICKSVNRRASRKRL